MTFRAFILAAAIAGVAWADDRPVQPPSAIMPDIHFGFFEKYCLDCHDGLTSEGNMNLEEIDFDLGSIQSAETWQKVLNSINSGEMPPPDKPQPQPEDKASFLEALSNQLVVARALLSDTGGEITMRRLNRREYENTIRELLGVEIDAGDLPEDSNPGGFDTAGGSLFFSSDQFEQYLNIARQALDAAIVSGPKPKSKKVRVEVEKTANRTITNRLNNLQKSWDRAQAWRADPTQNPRDFGFIDSARVAFEEGVYRRQAPGYKEYLGWPTTKNGAVPHTQFGGAFLVKPDIPAKAPPGDYLLRLRVGVIDQDVPWSQRFVEYGTLESGARTGEMSVAGCFHVRGSLENPEVIEIPISLSEISSRNYAFRERQVNNRDFARFVFQEARSKKKSLPDPALWIDWIEWEGPLHEEWPPSSHRMVFPGEPDGRFDREYAGQTLKRFATRAFRSRAPSQGYLDKLLGLYDEQIAIGKSPRQAIREPLAVILASPGFLYLTEPVEKPWLTEGGKSLPKRVPLTRRELAVRLSYFLWSSPPDEELIELARSGSLKDPKVLRAQTERLLSDPRSREFVAGFTHQWLHMERLDFFNYNYRKYREFDESVKESSRQEVYRTIETIIRENRSLADLLDPDYLVVNDVLTNYYRLGGLVGGVKGSEFRKVSIPKGSPRGGLLGMAAILAMGSDGERTSPVERGSWVMSKLLNSPPPPAPANVPQLSRNSDKLVGARELLSLHMEEAQCAQCHRRIDPIGFGMEHFDAAGLWREKELIEQRRNNRVVKTKALPIDSSGTLPDGTAFANFRELKDRIAEREDDFAMGFTEHLIEYALGRPFGFSDLNLADSIIRKAAEEDHAMKAFIHAMVQSRAFRLK